MDIVNVPANLEAYGFMPASEVNKPDDVVVIVQKVNSLRDGSQYINRSITVQEFLAMVPPGTDILWYANAAAFPPVGQINLVYVDKSTGDLYQWNGASYTFLSPGNNPTLAQVLTNGRDVDVNGKVNDVNSLESADFNARTLTPTGGAIYTVDWENKFLVDDAIGFPVVSWGPNKHLNATFGTTIDWENMNLFNAANNLAIDWNNLVMYDPAVSVSIDWLNRKLVDTLGSDMLNWENKEILAGTPWKYLDGNEGLNKVLTSDAVGNMTWQVPGGAAVNIAKVAFVSNDLGNDGTAVKGDLTKPYKTIVAAQTAAIAGDVVWVHPGSYAGNSLGKQDITYYFEPGSIVTGVNIFSSKAASGFFKVLGQGSFTCTSGAVCFISHANAKIEFECYYAEGTGAPRVFRIDGNDGIMVIKATTDLINKGSEQLLSIYGQRAKMYVDARRVIGWGMITQMNDSAPDCVLTIDADEVRWDPGNVAYIAFNNSSGTMTIRGDVILNQTSAYGTPDADLRNFNNYVGGARTFIHGNWSSIGIHLGIYMRFDNCSVDIYGKVNYNAASSIAPIALAVGACKINLHDDVVSVRTAPIVSVAAGKAIIHGLIKNLGASATSHGIQTTISSGVILRQGTVIYVTDPGADSVNAAAPQTIKTYPGAVTNKALNVNITEQVSTILVDANVDSE